MSGARTPRSVIAGRVLSALAIVLLALDAGGKLIAPALMIAHSPPLGLPPEVGFYRMLGVVLATAVALYAWPQTAFLGAILLTGYLGGAVATHARVGSPLLSSTLFGVYLGLLVWGGLYLRDPAARVILKGGTKR